MKTIIRLFAMINASLWLWNLIYHTLIMDTTIWILVCYFIMFGISVWLYEIKSKDEKNTKEEN